MKPLKLSFALILTALGLLLNTAKRGKSALSKNVEKLKKKIQSPHERNTSYPENDWPQEVASTLIQIPDSILQEYRANQKQQERDNKLNRRIALWAVLGAWIYAGIAFWQVQEMRSSSANAERPWAGIGNVVVIDKTIPNKPIKISAPIINGGKSPAIYMTISQTFKLWATTRTDGSLPLHTEISTCTKPLPKWKDDLNGTVLIPGVVQYIEGTSPPISPVMFNFWSNKKPFDDPAEAGEEVVFGIKPKPSEPWMIGLFFVGCLNYFDQQHRPHRTSWCYYYDPSRAVLYGSFILCDKGNSAD